MSETLKVTITNQQILLASQALAVLVKVKRPVLGALKMRQLARALQPHIEDYEAERQKLLDAHGDHDAEGKRKLEDGQVLFADAAARAAFDSAMADLLACTWECPVRLTVKDFGGLDVEPELLVALGELLEEPTEG